MGFVRRHNIAEYTHVFNIKRYVFNTCHIDRVKSIMDTVFILDDQLIDRILGDLCDHTHLGNVFDVAFGDKSDHPVHLVAVYVKVSAHNDIGSTRVADICLTVSVIC